MAGSGSGVALIGAVGVAAGVAVALQARRRIAMRPRYEGLAGLLLVGSLFLIGCGLPVFR